MLTLSVLEEDVDDEVVVEEEEEEEDTEDEEEEDELFFLDAVFADPIIDSTATELASSTISFAERIIFNMPGTGLVKPLSTPLRRRRKKEEVLD